MHAKWMKENASSLHGALMCSREGAFLRGEEVQSRVKPGNSRHNFQG